MKLFQRYTYNGKPSEDGELVTYEAAIAKCNEMAKLLVESWDALAAVIKVEHLRLHDISPTLCERIKVAIEPWNTGEPR